MNGRVYDPKLGRFMSADPHIQAHTDTQSLNRYSYVLNNPLSATDSSGYFFKKLLQAISSNSLTNAVAQTLSLKEYKGLLAITYGAKGAILKKDNKIFAEAKPPVINAVDATGAATATKAGAQPSLPFREDIH